MSQYKDLSDVLPPGKHPIRVYPKSEWDDIEKKWKRGTHYSGVTKTGNKFWHYTTKVGDQYITIPAWDEQEKALLDEGDIEVNIVQRINKDKKPVWKLGNDGMPLQKDGKPIPALKYFINSLNKETPRPAAESPADGLKTPSETPLTDAVEQGLAEKGEKIDDLPF